MLDAKELRAAFGAYPTGVTVVTTCDTAGAPVGFTANSFASVSLDPPMLSVCPGRRLSTFAVFAACERFAVNVLAGGQEEVSNRFAGYKGDRFADTAWAPGPNGAPFLDGAAARFACRTAQIVPAGDHVILLGEIEAFDRTGAPGLGYAAGRYVSLEPAPAAMAGAVLERDGHVLLRDGPEGLRPPEIVLADPADARTELEARLAADGIEATLERAYSVFTDWSRRAHVTYFVGRAARPAVGEAVREIPIADLADAPIAGDARRAMLRRFAQEHPTRSFALYVGDAAGGEIHAF